MSECNVESIKVDGKTVTIQTRGRVVGNGLDASGFCEKYTIIIPLGVLCDAITEVLASYVQETLQEEEG